MVLDISIQYRGLLSGCNYDCPYCPFAKHVDSRDTLAKDAADLQRFVDWIAARPADRFRVLFTPWGEALIRKPYQQALTRLSHMPQIARVAIQTNLSCGLSWIDALNSQTASLWCTYHPGETNVEKFLAQCAILDAASIPYCVGSVGIKSAFEAIARLRERLPEHVYLWVNAYKDEGQDYYTPQDIAFLTEIDPQFGLNLRDYPSLGRACNAGQTSMTIDGNGDARRCILISEIIGNIYDQNFEASLRPRLCSRGVCDCHIAYANMPELNLDNTFNGWALGRMLPMPKVKVQ